MLCLRVLRLYCAALFLLGTTPAWSEGGSLYLDLAEISPQFTGRLEDGDRLAVLRVSGSSFTGGGIKVWLTAQPVGRGAAYRLQGRDGSWLNIRLQGKGWQVLDDGLLLPNGVQPTPIDIVSDGVQEARSGLWVLRANGSEILSLKPS